MMDHVDRLVQKLVNADAADCKHGPFVIDKTTEGHGMRLQQLPDGLVSCRSESEAHAYWQFDHAATNQVGITRLAADPMPMFILPKVPKKTEKLL